MGPLLIIAEHREKKLRDITFEMITLAKRVAKEIDQEVEVLLLGDEVEEMAEEITSYGLQVLLMEDPALAIYQAPNYIKAVRSVIESRNPSIVMTGQTAQGVDFMPALAVTMDLPLIPEVVDLHVEENKVMALRQIYSGKVNAYLSFKGDETKLVTLREASFQPPEREGQGEIERLSFSMERDPNQSFIEYREAEVGDVDITSSQVLIALGRGLKEEKNLPLAQSLADLLSGDLCGSRPAIDQGWLPNDRQVGVSGKTVKPNLYLALGISGAFQHTTGMKAAKKVIAINKDPDAPIFSVADYAIVDDLFKVVPALTEKLQEMKE